MACYNSCSKKCCLFGVLFTGFFCLAFHLMLIGLIDLSIKSKLLIKGSIFSEKPLYNVSFSEHSDINGKNYYPSFYDFDGKIKESYDSQSQEIIEKHSIYILYQNYFFYNTIDNRTYYDYIKDYSVAEGENCKINYKKCGILNNKGRILCLPEEEECPLNGFAISSNNEDSRFEGYSKSKVKDSDSGLDYYFYYTNKNINKNIITNFKLSDGYPCALSSEKSWITVFSNEANKNPNCKTAVEGNLRNENYIKIEGSEIKLISLYMDNGISYTGPETDSIKIQNTVNLYARNYYDKDEECAFLYYSNIEKADNSFKTIQLIIRIINIISLVFIIALIIYCVVMCRYLALEFYWPFLIIHIYGLAENIVSICLTYQYNFQYKCDTAQISNNVINHFYEKNKSDNRALVLAMCILSIVSLGLNFLCSICLKNNKNYGYLPNQYGYPQNYATPNGVGQDVIIKQVPFNGSSYAQNNAGKINNPNYIVPVINNEINPNSN